MGNETLDRFANAREDEKQSFLLTDFAKQNPSLRGVEHSGMTRQSRKKFDLKGKKNLNCLDARNEIIEKRKKCFPLNEGLGSAGCFFKNLIISKDEFKKIKERFPRIPNFEEEEKIKIPSAWFVDKFGWKGFNEGEVGVYDKHALMLVNKGEGTCEEIKELAQKISDDVFEKTGLRLEEEIVCV